MISAILVDDMPQALQMLEQDLRDHCPEINVIGRADSIVSAAKLLKKESPDILFLDILLGDGTGFDLLEIFPDLASKVIFVTASDEHAIRAFRFAAIDYLLKPVDITQLKEAVDRAKVQIEGRLESLEVLKETIRKPDTLPSRMSLHTKEKIAVVEIERIIRCEADGNNTQFFVDGSKRIFVTKTLKHFERLLQEHSFMRVHQSHLINIKYIHEYIRRDGGYLLMKNGDTIPVAVRKKTELFSLLERMK